MCIRDSPNSNWIRSVHGSKSVTIGNPTDAYNKAAHGNGFTDAFVCGAEEKEWIKDVYKRQGIESDTLLVQSFPVNDRDSRCLLYTSVSVVHKSMCEQ